MSLIIVVIRLKITATIVWIGVRWYAGYLFLLFNLRPGSYITQCLSVPYRWESSEIRILFFTFRILVILSLVQPDLPFSDSEYSRHVGSEDISIVVNEKGLSRMCCEVNYKLALVYVIQWDPGLTILSMLIFSKRVEVKDEVFRFTFLGQLE